MMTFLAFAERAKVSLARYESAADGQLEFIDGGFQFTRVTIRPHVLVKPGTHVTKARELMAKAEKYCLVSRSVKSEIAVEASISEGDDNSRAPSRPLRGHDYP
jgi:organic hydroperoxide reductase OsmC/OhrA